MLTTRLALAACLAVCAGTAYAQTGPDAISDIMAPVLVYDIYVPETMIRGENYRGLIVASLPADEPTVFRFGAGGGDIVLPESVTMEAGTNHALFDMLPADSPILSGRVSTSITVIPPDGDIREIGVETHPGAGTISRLWIVGPGADGVVCDRPGDTTVDAIAGRAADGVFDEPEPTKEIRTRLPQAAIHVFLADRYCMPVTAPVGGVGFTVSTDTPGLTFGGGRTHITGVIPQGFNSAVLDIVVNGAGTVYATGNGVSPDSIKIGSEPVDAEVRLGVGPSWAMESSVVTWFVWLERNGKQYVPDGPVPVYLTTDNPVLASFEQSRIDATGPVFSDIRPHHAYMLDGLATGVLHTGTPAVVGDLRLLAGDREIEVTAHVPGYGSATAVLQVGMPGTLEGELQVQTDQLQECMKEEGILPDGFYSSACTEMWQRLLAASHFFDIQDAAGEPLDTAGETVDFLDRLFGGDNTESGQALFELVNRINEYSLVDEPTAGLAGELTDLLGQYLRTSDVAVERVQTLGVTAEMLERVPKDPLPNELVLEAFPGRPGTANVVISTLYEDGSFRFPVYVPDGTVTLASDWGIEHEPEIRTYGSSPRPEAPGTRPAAVVVPVRVVEDGILTASLGGVGSSSVMIDDMAPTAAKRLHVSTLPGSGERDLIAILSVLDSDGLLTSHSGEIYVEAGQGARDVELVGWRGGGGLIRGSVDGVGEIVIHAPGLGGGTALTTPLRHAVGLDVWYPERVHVAEEFPIVAHTLDAAGQPVRVAQVTVSGNVLSSGEGLELDVAGEAPIIVEHGGMFHAGVIEGFLNSAAVSVDTTAGGVVELNDTVVVNVNTGAMQNPRVTVHGGTLVFSGEHGRWEALADNAGTHDIVVRVSEPGWESFSDVLPLRVSHLLDLEYEATTKAGVLADADLTICGQAVLARSLHQLEPGLCEVSVPREMSIGDVSHKLVLLEVNGQAMQPGGRYNFAEDSVVRATYEGVVTVEAHATFPDGMSEELLWGEYAPGDTVTVLAEPQYELWGLVWDRPDRWTGLPSGAIRVGDAASWEVTGDVAVNVEYKRDMTYLIIAGAAGLGIPVGFLMRGRILGLLSR